MFYFNNNCFILPYYQLIHRQDCLCSVWGNAVALLLIVSRFGIFLYTLGTMFRLSLGVWDSHFCGNMCCFSVIRFSSLKKKKKKKKNHHAILENLVEL
jgi:hypothetical protein